MKKFNPSAYLADLNVNVMRFGLEAITALMARFGNPQSDYKTILIAGTNGKGSTAAMIASVLKQAGLKVGLYTSPHLVDVRERIVVNGKKIPFGKFAGILSEIRDETALPVTYFEVLTAAAFLHFQREQVDIAVLEAGLGGRLDATNICQPMVSVITNIGLEHTAYLGNTLTAIAGEKAGIIKPGGVCVTAARQKKVVQTISSVCRQRQSVLYRLGQDFQVIRRADHTADYRGMNRRISGLKLALPGGHQWSNAALALAALEIAEKCGFVIDNAAIRAGLRNTHWEARMEVLCARPLFMLDGAHNPSGVRVLRRALNEDFPRRRLILIFAALADKNYREMLKMIAPMAAMTILPPLKTERSVLPRQMACVMQDLGHRALVARSVDQAVDKALAMAGDKDMILALGSFYLASEIKQSFHQTRSCGKA